LEGKSTKIIIDRPRTLSDLVPDEERRDRLRGLTRAREEALNLRLKTGRPAPTDRVKESTLMNVSLCKNGVTIPELQRTREFRIALLCDEGKMPSRKCLSMRLLRYSRQSLVKRLLVDGEYRYSITEKGELYKPRESLSRRMEQVFRLLRKDPRYLSLISDRWIDAALEQLFTEHAKTLEGTSQ